MRDSRFPNQIVRVALTLVLFKLVYVGLIYACLTMLPVSYSDENRELNFHRTGVLSWEKYFDTWDSAHYLALAESGYRPGTRSTAFYPLWPIILKVARPVFNGNTTLTGLVLANVFSIAGLTWLHALVQRKQGTAVANRTLLLLLAAPGAFSLFFPFTEALFLLLCVGIWWFIEVDRDSSHGSSKRGLALGTLLFLAAATRPTGVLWIVPLLVYLAARKRWEASPLLFAPVLGAAMYFVLVHLGTGNAFEGWAQQQQFVSKPSLSKVFNLLGFWSDLSRPLNSRHGFLDSPYDRIFLLWVLATLPFFWKRDKVAFSYTLVMGLIPAMTVSFMSYIRYVLPLVPSFAVAAQWFGRADKEQQNPSAFYAVLAALWGIQIMLLIRHLNFYWAA